MAIYFIRAGEKGPVLVGWGLQPKKKLVSIQRHHYEILRLVGVMEGGQKEEFAVRGKIGEHHLANGWFAPHADVLRIVVQATPLPPRPPLVVKKKPILFRAFQAVHVRVKTQGLLSAALSRLFPSVVECSARLPYKRWARLLEDFGHDPFAPDALERAQDLVREEVVREIRETRKVPRRELRGFDQIVKKRREEENVTSDVRVLLMSGGWNYTRDRRFLYQGETTYERASLPGLARYEVSTAISDREVDEELRVKSWAETCGSNALREEVRNLFVAMPSAQKPLHDALCESYVRERAAIEGVGWIPDVSVREE